MTIGHGNDEKHRNYDEKKYTFNFDEKSQKYAKPYPLTARLLG